ncbi:uncharacterized protein LOC127255326 [Andrographis paniculata]|uniref:uncharacterized protein LOC127255326 n=1 Tax=Andrographis paniculata TaxID=175694 RepID=UPI0021E86D08|nr:uncharacterized protein LOC127255326 [Andrographis paniculata]XP_051136775.1 uncharacterized protein LOC127255326 [Andrographis paniculata]
MEALYKKLYNKYTKLKKEKETQLDELNRDQEAKFLNFVTAADAMIQYLKSENERLNGQVDDLKSELAAIRTSNDEQHSQLQKRLMEENQKNKELSEEIARLQNLGNHTLSLHVTGEEIDRQQEHSHEDAPVGEMSKKRKYIHTTEGNATPKRACVDLDAGAPSIQQPVCCQKRISSSGGDTSGGCSVNCVFQLLVEFVVGMKVSVRAQNNELCVLVHHQSSGYSFSLTWVTNTQGEVELLYRVVSMGTFERVAPEWMKEPLMFSSSMCSIFFERVSRVIKN